MNKVSFKMRICAILLALLVACPLSVLAPMHAQAEETDSVVTLPDSNPVLDKSSITFNLSDCYKYSDGFYEPVEGKNYIKVSGIASGDSAPVATSSSSNLKIYWNDWDIDSNGNIVYYYYYVVKGKGTYNVSFATSNGKKVTATIKALNFYYKRSSKNFRDGYKSWVSGLSTLIMYKGETTQLATVGQIGKVTWKSTNTKIAKVSSTGKVTAIGSGRATIQAKNSGITINYRIEVASKTAIKAVRYCIKNYNSKYSQSKRMKKGYYDCSSFVWRNYKSAGKKLKSYCPTAADMAKWCVSNKVMRYKGNVPTSKLLPGDLIFECGAKNGRYKGIYHVDMYQGNTSSLTVARTKYWGSKMYNVMVARPCGGRCKMVTYK